MNEWLQKLKVGDFVIVSSSRGLERGEVIRGTAATVTVSVRAAITTYNRKGGRMRGGGSYCMNSIREYAGKEKDRVDCDRLQVAWLDSIEKFIRNADLVALCRLRKLVEELTRETEPEPVDPAEDLARLDAFLKGQGY